MAVTNSAGDTTKAAKLRVGVDVTPMFGPTTGVGAVTSSIVRRLDTREDITLVPVVISWKAQQILTSSASSVSDGNGLADLAGGDIEALRFPARLAHRLWHRFDWPALSGLEVVHGINFVVPPSRDGVELVTIHDLTAWHMPELVDQYSLGYPTLVRRAVKRGAHIHAVSAAVAAEVIETIDIDPTKVHTVHNGFDLSISGEGNNGVSEPELVTLRQSGQSLAGGPYVLCLGTVEPRKDHPGLVEAMVRVWGKHRTLRLVIAGGEGWGAAALEKALEDHDLQDDDRIVRLGYVTDSDREALLAGAKCLAYPSLYEGFGLPPLEAMALGTPVVATSVPAVAEVCGDAAILVPIRKPELLAESIIEVVDGAHPNLAAKGRERVLQFDWDRTVEQLVTLYRAISNR